MQLLRTHPYLFSNLPLLALLLPILIRTRRHQLSHVALFSGLACLPCSILALPHEGRYWSPTRLAGGPYGIEDLVFSVVAGMIVWLAAAWPFRALALPEYRLAPAPAKRILFWGAASVVLLFGLWRSGMDVMSATLLAAIPLFIALLVRRSRLWPLALTGVACFVPLYVALVNLQFAVWPGYVVQWNPNSPWTKIVLGIPAGEIAWAVMFAAIWPVTVASLFDLRLKS